MKYRAFDKNGNSLHQGTSLIRLNDNNYIFATAWINDAGGWIEDEASNVVYGRKPAGTIDLTPTWSSMLPVLLVAYTDGTAEGKRLAKLELERMARIADNAGKE